MLQSSHSIVQPLKGALLLALAIGLLPAVARAEEAEAAREDESGSEWIFVSSVGRLIELLPSGDPDEPALKFTFFGGRGEAMAGGQLMIAGRRAESFDLAINLSGFIALVNFQEGHAMPWQTFRGFLGINTMWRSRWLDRRILPRNGTLIFELGFFHESDHAVDSEGFVHTFLVSSWMPFDNGNFSSFEYVKIRLRYQQSFADQRVEWLNAVGVRAFTPSINPWARRELRYSVSVETRVAVRLIRRLFFDFGIFYEAIINDFVAARNNFRGDLDHTPLQELLFETGLLWRSRIGQTLGLSFLVSRSHGRGLDFAMLRTEWGVGIRGQL